MWTAVQLSGTRLKHGYPYISLLHPWNSLLYILRSHIHAQKQPYKEMSQCWLLQTRHFISKSGRCEPKLSEYRYKYQLQQCFSGKLSTAQSLSTWSALATFGAVQQTRIAVQVGGGGEISHVSAPDEELVQAVCRGTPGGIQPCDSTAASCKSQQDGPTQQDRHITFHCW